MCGARGIVIERERVSERAVLLAFLTIEYVFSILFPLKDRALRRA